MDAGAADDGHGADPIEEYDYDTNPGWMIGLSPRFGMRYLTLDQRMGLLAVADENLWREVLAVARQVYASPHVRGGSKEFGCNQQYASLLRAAANALDCGGTEALQAFLRLFVSVIRSGNRLHIDPDGTSMSIVRW